MTLQVFVEFWAMNEGRDGLADLLVHVTSDLGRLGQASGSNDGTVDGVL